MKKFLEIGACFFPTQTIFIDDSKEFLESISLKLSYVSQTYKFYSNITEAMSYLKDQKRHYDWLNKYIKNIEEELDNRKLIEVNINELHKEIYNSNRFNIVTNIVIDYDMPQMNGLEVCKQLQGFPVNKILLTGAADERLAVNAFNAGLINCFIPKNSAEIYTLLKDSIKQGSSNYFNNLSQIIWKSLLNEDIIFFKDEKVIAFFNQLISKYDIIEYYLLESSGTFLMINSKGDCNYSPVSQNCGNFPSNSSLKASVMLTPCFWQVSI